MPKRRTAAQTAASRRNLEKARAAKKFKAPATGPGSVKWAESSILFRHGKVQAAKEKIVRIYPPTYPKNEPPKFLGSGSKSELRLPMAKSNANALRAQYISFLKGHKLRRKVR
jgi:hypothetical protein